MKMKIHQVMSSALFHIAPSDSLATARDLMQANAVRHLPVVDGELVVGMISQSDLFVMEATFGADPDATQVEEAMARDVYVVGPDAPLGEVARTMAERHVGSAMVVEGGRLVGLFTATDACRVLGEVLSRD